MHIVNPTPSKAGSFQPTQIRRQIRKHEGASTVMITRANDINCARAIVRQNASAESACRPAAPVYICAPSDRKNTHKLCAEFDK